MGFDNSNIIEELLFDGSLYHKLVGIGTLDGMELEKDFVPHFYGGSDNNDIGILENYDGNDLFGILHETSIKEFNKHHEKNKIYSCNDKIIVIPAIMLDYPTKGQLLEMEVDGFEIINGKLLTTKLIYLPKDTILTILESGFHGPFVEAYFWTLLNFHFLQY
nr:5731_t:CDS:2 [Entrophospora candida]